MLLEAIEPIEDTKDFNIHKDTCLTLAATHTHTCWTCCILHSWLPDNTDETLDWIEVPAVMKTNYLDDSRHCQEILLDATLHHISVIVFCREYSTFSVSPDTKVLSPQRRGWWQNEAITSYATAPLSFKSSKGQKAQISRKNPAGVNPKWKQTKCQICSACEFITMWMSPLQNEISAALMHESGGCISGRDPPPILVHTSCPPEPPLPLPVLFPIAIMQWCHEETRKAVLTPSFLELKGRWIGLTTARRNVALTAHDGTTR